MLGFVYMGMSEGPITEHSFGEIQLCNSQDLILTIQLNYLRRNAKLFVSDVSYSTQ